MIINFILEIDGTVEIHVGQGNHLPRWVQTAFDARFKKDIYLQSREDMERFIKLYEENGHQYTEGRSSSSLGLIRDSIPIRNPEQLGQIYKVMREHSKIDNKGLMRAKPEDFVAIKKDMVAIQHGANPKTYKDLQETYKRSAAAGFFSGRLPPDVGYIIGSYLDIKSAGRLTRTKKSVYINIVNRFKDLKSLKSKITFEEFKTRYLQQYDKETFTNPLSKMLRMLKGDKINSMDKVLEHINSNPDSRAAKVFKELIKEHVQNDLGVKKNK